MSQSAVSPQGWFRQALSVFGVILIGWAGIANLIRHDIQPWMLGSLFFALAAWLVLAFLPDRFDRVAIVCLAVMTVAGSLVAAPTTGTAIVPPAVAVMWLARDLRRSLVWPLILGLIGMVVVLVGNVIQPVAPLGLLAIEGALVLAFLSGQNRRQFLMADAQARRLLQERSRIELMAARGQIARDIHDVLAHSLGGLVIQLDAVDALLESGDGVAAASRVKDARALAADGLSEARKAVAALGASDDSDSTALAGAQLVDDLSALVSTHRSLGGVVHFAESGERRSVSVALESALRRAMQEGLTNARKHAPGEDVTAALDWTGREVTLSLSNDLAPDAIDQTGGGNGLGGMRDRFAALPGGSATAFVEADRFVVTVRGATA
jgi:signal transduction histidine kinase